MHPSEAISTYIQHRESEVSDATLESHKSRLRQFKRWCEREDIDDVAELSPPQMHEYRVWRRRDGDLSPAAEKTQMDTVRVFLRHLENIGIIDVELSTAVISPELSGDDKRSAEMIDLDTAHDVLNVLDRYEYATMQHALFVLAWDAGLRTSALRALDVSDYDRDEKAIEVVNRPEQGTRLKTGTDGERYVALQAETASIVGDYIDRQRPSVTDDYGREPLLATEQGRAAKSTIRRWLYAVTRPCWVDGGCPHDRNPDTCTAAQNRSHAYECPSSMSPHSLRRASITYMLAEDVPKHVVSSRCDVSEEVLDEHYDERGAKRRMEQRRQYIDDL